MYYSFNILSLSCLPTRINSQSISSLSLPRLKGLFHDYENAQTELMNLEEKLGGYDKFIIGLRFHVSI